MVVETFQGFRGLRGSRDVSTARKEGWRGICSAQPKVGLSLPCCRLLREAYKSSLTRKASAPSLASPPSNTSEK